MVSVADERETKALIQILELGDRKFDDGQGVFAWKVLEQLRRKKAHLLHPGQCCNALGDIAERSQLTLRSHVSLRRKLDRGAEDVIGAESEVLVREV